MADAKISALTNLTAADPTNDMIPIVDVSDTPPASGNTKRISINNILSSSPTASGALTVTGLVTAGSATITGALTVDTTTLVVDSTNNRVGINKASPAYALDVVGNATISSTAGNNNWFYIAGNGNTVGATSFDIGQSASNEGYVFNRANGPIIFGVNNTTAMTLDTNGLGIGTTVYAAGTKFQVRTASNINLAFQSGTTHVTGIKLNAFNNAGSANIPLELNGSILSLKTGETERLQIDASGNVGIGVTPSTAWNTGTNLQVGAQAALYTNSSLGAVDLTSNSIRTGSDSYQYLLAGSNQASRFTQRDGAFRWFSAAAGTSPNAITFGDAKMTLDASGYLLLGTTDTAFTSGAGYKFGPGATPSNGQVGASSSNGDLTFRVYSTGAAAYRFYVGYGGTVFATSATISAISDSRFKENVQDIDVGLNAILSLKPRKFDWKAGKGKDIKGDRGFIAQEFETVFPNLIDEWADPAPEGEAPYKSVRQDLIPVLVKAIQELTARVQTLEAK